MLEIKGDIYFVEDEDGFYREYKSNDLINVGDTDEEREMYGNTLPDLCEVLARDISEERQKRFKKSSN